MPFTAVKAIAFQFKKLKYQTNYFNINSGVYIVKIDLDEYIKEAFDGRWFGETVLYSLDSMKAQLYKNLKDQKEGYWSGSTAYMIMIDYGFLVDANHENRQPKKLTRLGQIFMDEFESNKD